MSGRPRGRCVGCLHDFNNGPCPGCGAIPLATEPWTIGTAVDVARAAAVQEHRRRADLQINAAGHVHAEAIADAALRAYMDAVNPKETPTMGSRSVKLTAEEPTKTVPVTRGFGYPTVTCWEGPVNLTDDSRVVLLPPADVITASLGPDGLTLVLLPGQLSSPESALYVTVAN